MSSTERTAFEPGELAVVLSYYDVGVIESVTDLPRGSRRSPKVGVVAQNGKFLLKRRSLQWVPLERVKFVHRVQGLLSREAFPTARLIPTRSGETLVQIRDDFYELFEFVPGQPFAQTPAESREAGLLLARFHRATEKISPAAALAAPRGDYHDAPGVRAGLGAIGSTLSSHDSFAGDHAELAALVQQVHAHYDRTAQKVADSGYSNWSEHVIHGDWHPGNLLYRNAKVLAVIDYDAMRFSRRAADVANGALQFSILAGGDPAGWPDQLDEDRLFAFLNGYESLTPLLPQERSSLIAMMCEALIAECVGPIAATGSMGRWSGLRILRMARRKLDWLAANADRLLATLATPDANKVN